MSWLSDFIFGSKGEIDWKELGKMVELQAQVNRTDRQGAFTGWEWDRDPITGQPGNTQTQTINPAFQGAVDRLGFNAGKPADPYTSPSQFSEMLDAKMANQMDRQGLDTSGYQQQNPGQFDPSADRAGRFAQSYLPPAPPGDVPPPGGVVPPPGDNQDPPPGDNRPPGGGGGGRGPGKGNNRLHMIADDGGYI